MKRYILPLFLLLLLSPMLPASAAAHPSFDNPIPNPQNHSGLWCLWLGGLDQGAGSVTPDKAGHGTAYATHVNLAGGKGVTSDGGGISDEFAVAGGTSYVLTMYWKGDLSETAVLRPGIALYDAGNTFLAHPDDAINFPSGEWRQWSLGFTTPETATQAIVEWNMWEDGVNVGNVEVSDWNLQPAALASVTKK